MATPKPSVEEYLKKYPVAKDYAEQLLEIAFTAEELNEATKDLARRVSEDYKDIYNEGVILVGVLKGCALFYGNFLQNVTIPVETEFIQVSSYAGTETTSNIVMKKDIAKETLQNKHVIIVEDLIDTGHTLAWIIEYLKSKEPKSVKLLCLLDKPARREVKVDVDYIGLECPNKFVVGYGMDFNEKMRNMPFLAVLKPEAYKQ